MIHYSIDRPLEIGLRFEEFPTELHDDLLAEITALGREAFAGVAARLPRGNGKLADQQRMRIIDEQGRIAAIVDFAGDADDARKAGALEYGSRGRPIAVRAHQRRQTHVFERHLAAPRQVLVDAYDRRPHLQERRFIRGTADAIRAQAVERIQAVVSKAVEHANS